jgi:hypothetical protein
MDLVIKPVTNRQFIVHIIAVKKLDLLAGPPLPLLAPGPAKFHGRSFRVARTCPRILAASRFMPDELNVPSGMLFAATGGKLGRMSNQITPDRWLTPAPHDRW